MSKCQVKNPNDKITNPLDAWEEYDNMYLETNGPGTECVYSATDFANCASIAQQSDKGVPADARFFNFIPKESHIKSDQCNALGPDTNCCQVISGLKTANYKIKENDTGIKLGSRHYMPYHCDRDYQKCIPDPNAEYSNHAICEFACETGTDLNKDISTVKGAIAMNYITGIFLILIFISLVIFIIFYFLQNRKFQNKNKLV